MGKKPVLGLVGLAWLGLTIGGCKSGCDCDKTVQKPPRRPDNYAKSWRQPKPQDAAAQQTQPQTQVQEGTVASKGDPRLRPAYDYDDSKRDPVEKGSVARQLQEVPQQLPAEKLTAESTAVMKKPAGSPELLQTGRTTETPAATEGSRPEVLEHKPIGIEGTVPAQVGQGPDLGDVRPPAVGGAPAGAPGSIPAVPTVEKVGGTTPVPPPPPMGAAPGMAPEPMRELAPAAPAPLPAPSQPLSAVPPAPPSEASKVVDPVSGPTPPAPVSPVVEVPPPPSAMQNGVKEGLMPPLPTAPASTPQLPQVQSPYNPSR